MDTELARIGEECLIAGKENSAHSTVSPISLVLGTISVWHEELRSSTQAEAARRSSQDAHVHANASVGQSVRVGGKVDGRASEGVAADFAALALNDERHLKIEVQSPTIIGDRSSEIGDRLVRDDGNPLCTIGEMQRISGISDRQRK